MKKINDRKIMLKACVTDDNPLGLFEFNVDLHLRHLKERLDFLKDKGDIEGVKQIEGCIRKTYELYPFLMSSN